MFRMLFLCMTFLVVSVAGAWATDYSGCTAYYPTSFRPEAKQYMCAQWWGTPRSQSCSKAKKNTEMAISIEVDRLKARCAQEAGCLQQVRADRTKAMSFNGELWGNCNSYGFD